MPQEKNPGGRNQGRTIDLNAAAHELHASRARANARAGAHEEPFDITELMESLDILANVAVYYLKKKGLKDRLFTEEEFSNEFE